MSESMIRKRSMSGKRFSAGRPTKDSRRKVAMSERFGRRASTAPLDSRVAMKSRMVVTMGFLPVSPSLSITFASGGTLVKVMGFMGVLSVMGSLMSMWG